MNDLHQPVLLQAAIDGLAIKEDGIYMDGTFGRGGHSQAILTELGKAGMLIAIDKDPQAVAFAKQVIVDPRFHIEHASFSEMQSIADRYHVTGRVNGILLDLGVSSPQLDDAARGFSFLKEGPLDMRMDPTVGLSAREWLAQAKESEIAEVLKKYGEERYAKRIARAIVAARAASDIVTTTQLASIIKEAHPRWEPHKHPATRSFQGIRIYINRELADLEKALESSLEVLAMGGRLAVISFHSLEDRITKRFMQHHLQGDDLPKSIPVPHSHFKPRLRCVIRKLKPSDEEIKKNIRARSATLRIMEKIS